MTDTIETLNDMLEAAERDHAAHGGADAVFRECEALHEAIALAEAMRQFERLPVHRKRAVCNRMTFGDDYHPTASFADAVKEMADDA